MSKITTKCLKSIKAIEKDNVFKDLIDSQRAIGTSTLIAFKTITESLSNINKEIEIIDHYPTIMANEHLEFMIMNMINRLGLHGFKINKKRHNIIHLIYTGFKETDA